MASDLERSDYREGCPIATTALETAAQSEVLGEATRSAFQKWELEIKRGLFRFGMPAGDADLAATLVLSQLEGALLLARTYRSLEPLRRAEHAVKLLAHIGDRNDVGLWAWAPMVPRKGLEPSRPLSHWHLKPARLPIPPPGPGPVSTDRSRACQIGKRVTQMRCTARGAVGVSRNR